jgi:superfamily I DNA/RNA helicase/RecB family exonuclease
VDRVADAGHGPLLVLAGPGTGKTTTIVEAVRARVAAGTDPERILTLTFSRRAAQELRARIGARLDRTVGSPLAWTFHGFGFSLLGRTMAAEDLGRRLTLLSGPEQDVTVRELLLGGEQVTPGRWPDALQPALPTRGFSEQLRTLLSRARSLGMEPADLAAAAVAGGREDWAAAAAFLGEYLDVLDAQGALDYSELVARAVGWAESPAGRQELRASYDLVVVDEYQDTDPAQERLLAALAGDGRDLVAVGDPDQSIYAFRGAQVGGILRFPERFRTRDGDPADIAVLQTCRRSGATLLAASRAVAGRLPVVGAGMTRALARHHDLVPAPGLAAGRVDVWEFASPGAEAAGIADLLRREHLQQGRPWSDMAVLVRSGVTTIPVLQRSLSAAGVPVEVAGDELPLVAAPAVACLLLALEVVVSPAALTAETAQRLLLSALTTADPAQLRRLGRALRDEERQAGTPPGSVPPSADLLRDAVADPRRLVAFADDVAGPARELAGLLAGARRVHQAGGSVYDVLWSLWSGTSWPQRLLTASQGGGPTARGADADLDAVVALFDVAARDEERREGRGLQSFLSELRAQQIPGDTLAERSARRRGVRLLTAHRSKGLEWPLVVVASVQEDEWPDLRHRGSLLEPERLDPSGPAGPRSAHALLHEERRLFYVAVTRAKERLVVTAVGSDEDDGPRPSRFLSELGVDVVRRDRAAERPLTLTALTADLRSCVVDPAQPPELRAAAASRLALLAGATEAGAPLVPAADPDRWWGVLDVTASDRPVRPAEQPLALSGSSLEGLVTCPLRWFLQHEVHAEAGRGTAMGFGSVVHAVADGVATGQLDADVDAAMAAVDEVWRQLAFAARWESLQQRQEAREAVERFLVWHGEQRGRTLLDSEATFRVEIEVGERTVLLRGRLDRVELDDAGRVVVVDFKTGRKAPTRAAVEDNLQLAVYQRAVREGAVPGVPAEPGGAELVHLRLAEGAGPKVQSQPPLPDGPNVLDEALATAVATVSEERFAPQPGPTCGFCPYRRVCPAHDEGAELLP